jgi:type VI secretion system protein ImpK
MRAEVAQLVFPVLTTGLQRKQELIAGVPLELKAVQDELRVLLRATDQTAAWVNAGGVQNFMGIKYALTCWLDEIFIHEDSPWKAEWAERKLEWALYNSTDRAWMFWLQCKTARELAVLDALEVFYLCVVLGFRGMAGEGGDEVARDWPDVPQDLKTWCDEIREQLDAPGQDAVALPPSGQPPTNVPALQGASHFQSMLQAWAVVLFIIAPALGFCVILVLPRWLGK